ncbi:MAG: putative lipid II flippase FtsW [Clostridia bacterium]|nr:putative lipid II flippase FtsW [Clostridia bacterium]
MIRKFFSHSTTSGLWQHKEDGPLDNWFLILVMALLTIGTVMMFSASYVYASYYKDDSFYYLKRQLFFAVMGTVLMLLASKVKISLYKKLAPLIMGIAFLLLVIVLFHHTKVEGSSESFKRWIAIGPITFQPSDLAKFALIVFFAYVIDNNKERIEKDWRYMLFFLAVIAVVCGLVAAENHLSGTILLGGIGIAMTFLGGVNKKWYIFFIGAGILVATLLIANMEVLPGYIQERLKSWLDEDYNPTGSRWQTNQSLYAIGSGGLFGTGLGGSKQKHLYLPEPHNDFIFAIVCEELGYIRTLGIILLFALFVFRGFYIGLRSKDRFTSLVVMGITFQVGLQTVLNIGVVTGMLPNTGISLPFFSYGGTALITLMVEMGIILSASRGIKKEI